MHMDDIICSNEKGKKINEKNEDLEERRRHEDEKIK